MLVAPLDYGLPRMFENMCEFSRAIAHLAHAVYWRLRRRNRKGPVVVYTSCVRQVVYTPIHCWRARAPRQAEAPQRRGGGRRCGVHLGHPFGIRVVLWEGLLPERREGRREAEVLFLEVGDRPEEEGCCA